MNWFNKAITSTIGQKILMALTGLFLVSFLFVHLSGNFQLFLSDGGQAFNAYTKFMTTNTVIRVAEIILVAGFALHIYSALLLTRRNNKARGVGYKTYNENKNVSWFSKNMGLTGTIILVFLIVHLVNFWGRYKFGAPGMDAWGNKDMYAIVKQTFQVEWWFSIFYILAMFLLAFHLNHGFQSAFRTLGLNHNKYTPIVTGIGTVIAVLVPAGFAAIPLVFLIKSMI